MNRAKVFKEISIESSWNNLNIEKSLEVAKFVNCKSGRNLNITQRDLVKAINHLQKLSKHGNTAK